MIRAQNIKVWSGISNPENLFNVIQSADESLIHIISWILLPGLGIAVMYFSISSGGPSPPSLVAVTLTQYMSMGLRPLTLKEVVMRGLVLQRDHSMESACRTSMKYPLASSWIPVFSSGLVHVRTKWV